MDPKSLQLFYDNLLSRKCPKCGNEEKLFYDDIARQNHELSLLVHEMWEQSDDWCGPRASSHYRSQIAEQIGRLTGKKAI